MQSIALEDVLKSYEGTVLFVSHDSAFVKSVAGRLIVFENGSLTTFEGTLEDYNQRRDKTQAKAMSATENSTEMKIAEIVAKLSNPCEDKEALEY